MYEKWLKAFHMVASQSSFTHAAKALNVGQPTISAHIKTLEDYFKVELFYRRGRTVELTDVGRSLFTITQGLYGHEAEAISYLRSIGRNDGGRLRLGAVGPHDVMALTQAFRQRYPRVELSVSVAPRDAIMAGLAGFDFDVGVVADAVTDSRYFCMLYDRHPVRIMVPHSHRLAKRRFLRIADLEGEGFILRDAGSATRRAFEPALLDAGVRIRPIMEINVREAVREAKAMIVDRRVEQHDILAVGNQTAMRYTWEATVAADGLLVPKGTRLRSAVAQFLTLRDGKISASARFMARRTSPRSAHTHSRRADARRS